MSYFIEFEPLAKRQFKNLTPKIQNLILQKLEKLKLNPRLGNIKKLVGEDNAYRLRIGNYRVIYEINDNILVIIIIQVGHRKEIYCH